MAISILSRLPAHTPTTKFRVTAWGRTLHESTSKPECERLALRLRNEGDHVQLEHIAIAQLPDDRRVCTNASRPARTSRALHMLKLAAIGGAA